MGGVQKNARVIDICAARTLRRSAKTLVEDFRLTAEVADIHAALFGAGIPDRDRPLLVESAIMTDIKLYDLRGTVLRKCGYALDKAEALEEELGAELVQRIARVITAYGKPEGIEVLAKALEKFRENNTMAGKIVAALVELAGRHPEKTDCVIETLERLGGPGRRFQQAIDDISGTAPLPPAG